VYFIAVKMEKLGTPRQRRQGLSFARCTISDRTISKEKDFPAPADPIIQKVRKKSALM
jgi:hypothetical protein